MPAEIQLSDSSPIGNKAINGNMNLVSNTSEGIFTQQMVDVKGSAHESMTEGVLTKDVADAQKIDANFAMPKNEFAEKLGTSLGQDSVKAFTGQINPNGVGFSKERTPEGQGVG